MDTVPVTLTNILPFMDIATCVVADLESSIPFEAMYFDTKTVRPPRCLTRRSLRTCTPTTPCPRMMPRTLRASTLSVMVRAWPSSSRA